MIETLKSQAKNIRKLTLKSIAEVGIGHVGGSLSIVDLLTILYLGNVMNVDPQNPQMPGRDRLIVSKGHAGPAVYATLATKGFFPVEELSTLNRIGTKLPSHCDMNKTPGIDMTAGSLGQGFSCAVGIAVGSKISKDQATIFTIIGDGESQEGQIWEAAMYASAAKLDNLIAFLDYNHLQIDGRIEQINTLGDIDQKWSSFGWFTQHIKGHDYQAILDAIKKAKAHRGRPSMIVLETVKGKGVSFVEAAGATNHNMPFSKAQYEQACVELDSQGDN